MRRLLFVLLVLVTFLGCTTPRTDRKDHDVLGVTQQAVVTLQNPGPADDADRPFNEDAIGEVLTAPSTATTLTSFSLTYTCPMAGGTIRGLVANWTNENHHTVGLPIYKSDPITLEAGTHTLTFTPNVSVTASALYVIFLSFKEDGTRAPQDCEMPMTSTNAFAGGELWATFFADYTLPNWGHFTDGNEDLLFSATFDEPPGTSPTTTSLAASPTTVSAGATITFTATVTGTPTPSTDVQFFEGATLLGTKTASGTGGTATAALDVATLGAGAHNVFAKFLPSGPLEGSTSNTVGVTVNKNTPTITVTPSPASAVAGQASTFTVTVNGGIPAATGTVTFDDGTTSTPATYAGVPVGFNRTYTTAGTRSITVSYSGDGNYNSGSKPVSYDVAKADTVAAVSSSKAPSNFGDLVKLTAQVTVVAPGNVVPTGTVELFDGATSLGSVGVDATGKAELSTSALSVSTHSITAVYSGDAALNGSTSSAFSQIVQKDGTTAGVTSSLNPSAFGDSVTFTATVLAVGTSGTPTGTVSFTDNGASMGADVGLVAGVAALATSTLSVGAHTIVATYNGDGNHSAGSTGSVVQTVNRALTSTSLASSKNPSAFGESITFTATVTSTAGTPTNAVVFSDGATQLKTASVTGGVATFTTSALAVGNHSISAVYQGDGNFTASSGALTQGVNTTPTTITLTSSSKPIGVGDPLTFTVTVSSATGAVPTGSVAIASDAVTLSTVTLDANGIGAFTTSSLAPGTHTITATYPGTASFQPSAAAPLTQVVNAAAATIALAATPSPAVFGATVTISGHVSGANGTPSGTISVHEGATVIGTLTLDASGVASLTTSTLGAGTHTITGDYSGDVTYGAGEGTVVLVVQLAPTTTTLSASANPAPTGSTVTLTATVSAGGGLVEFFDGATSIGQPALSGTTATFAVTNITAGAHPYTAKYLGDTNHTSSTSDVLTVNVSDDAQPADAGVDSGGPATTTDAGTGTTTRPDASAIDAGKIIILPSDNSSCDCDLTATSGPPGNALALLGLAMAAFGFRRRRAR